MQCASMHAIYQMLIQNVRVDANCSRDKGVHADVATVVSFSLQILSNHGENKVYGFRFLVKSVGLKQSGMLLSSLPSF